MPLGFCFLLTCELLGRTMFYVFCAQDWSNHMAGAQKICANAALHSLEAIFM